MNRKTISLFSFFLLFLMAISLVRAIPQYSGAAAKVAASTEYNPSTTTASNYYGFQILWNESTDSHDQIANATFECDFNGTTLNFTSQVTNNTAGIYWINFTFVDNITSPGTTRAYKWYATNETGSQNVTSSTSYNIAKNTSVPVRMNITVYAHGRIQSNHTDSNAQSVEGQGSPYTNSWMIWTNGTNFVDAIGNTIGTTACYRDGASWTKGSTGATSLGVASYTVKCNSTGNANYTNNATGASYNLTVIAAGGGGGGGGVPVMDVTPTTIIWTPLEEWELPEISPAMIVIGIIILAVIAKKKK